MNRDALSRFWFIFPCGLGLKIYYLRDSRIPLALSRLGGIFFKLFGKRARTSTISFGSSRLLGIRRTESRYVSGRLHGSFVKAFTLLLLL